MACDIKSQLIEKIKASPVFKIQLDESVDCANLSQLVFVCYIRNQTIEEDFLFCRSLQTTTKASDVLKLVKDFFTKENLHWTKLGSVCTNGGHLLCSGCGLVFRLLSNRKTLTLLDCTALYIEKV